MQFGFKYKYWEHFIFGGCMAASTKSMKQSFFFKINPQPGIYILTMLNILKNRSIKMMYYYRYKSNSAWTFKTF